MPFLISKSLLAYLHVRRSGLFESWFLSSQSRAESNLKSFSKCTDLLEKAGLPKRPLCCWICKQAMRYWHSLTMT